MKRVRPVEGKTLQEFADAYEEVQCELSRATIIEEKDVGPLQMLIFYEDPDISGDEPEADYSVRLTDRGEYVTVSLFVGGHKGYGCCDCDNYDWGRGCPYRSGRVMPTDTACPMFNVMITRG